MTSRRLVVVVLGGELDVVDVIERDLNDVAAVSSVKQYNLPKKTIMCPEWNELLIICLWRRRRRRRR